MAKTRDGDLTAIEACCAPDKAANTDRSGWLVALPIIGVLFCCGGPVIGTWIASAGLLAVLGHWWGAAGHWVMIALAVAAAGTAWWARTRRAPR